MSKTAEILLSKIRVDFLVHRGAVRAAQESVRSQKDNKDDTSSGAAFKKVGNRYHATALDGIDLKIQSGMRVGVIGHNGSGKSTLLRVISGVLEPTRGTLQVTGRIASMMSTTLGFDMRSTGRENITRRGMMMGMSRSEIEAQKADILDFADLGAFTDMPMSTYSDGMRARLGFAITTSMHANIVLMDEWIGAGDARFLERGRARLIDAIGRSDILVLATHKDSLIREMCTHVLAIDKGKVIHFDRVESLEDHPELLSEARKQALLHSRDLNDKLELERSKRETRYARQKEEALRQLEASGEALSGQTSTLREVSLRLRQVITNQRERIKKIRKRGENIALQSTRRIQSKQEELDKIESELDEKVKAAKRKIENNGED
ncbi:ATP-binding cassette domain-containing protein [Maricaulis sp. D1M11]|uniref:ABC transporter ATP-binding protein n=1 Tax=Maricaulis sp. D1M11 TaxID=3076117 RepID=UPI0039B3AF46